MRHDPFLLGLRLEGRSTLVVGAGTEAERRARALLDAGARVTLVSLDPSPGVRALATTGRLTLAERPFRDDDLEGIWLAVLTDLDPELAEHLGLLSESRRIFFCAVDQPAWSSYSHVALAVEGGLTVAISTGGRAPSLARRLRDEIQRLLAGSDLAGFVQRLAALREATPPGERRAVLGDAVAGVRIDGALRLPPGPETQPDRVT